MFDNEFYSTEDFAKADSFEKTLPTSDLKLKLGLIELCLQAALILFII